MSAGHSAGPTTAAVVCECFEPRSYVEVGHAEVEHTASSTSARTDVRGRRRRGRGEAAQLFGLFDEIVSNGDGILSSSSGSVHPTCGYRKLGYVADLRLREVVAQQPGWSRHRRAELHSIPIRPTRRRSRAESSALTPTQDNSPSPEPPYREVRPRRGPRIPIPPDTMAGAIDRTKRCSRRGSAGRTTAHVRCAAIAQLPSHASELSPASVCSNLVV